MWGILPPFREQSAGRARPGSNRPFVLTPLLAKCKPGPGRFPEEVGRDLEPLFERGVGGQVEGAQGGRAVEDTAALLAGRKSDMLGLLAVFELARDQIEEPIDGSLHTRAEVPGTALSAGRRTGRGFNEIADVDVVARLLAVAADLWSPALQNGFREDRDDARLAGAVLSRPVDVGVAEDLDLEAVDDAVVVQVLLDRELGATVGRDGIGRMVLARRTPSLGLPIERAAGRGEEDPADTRSPTRLEELQRPEDVGARVVQGIGDTVTQIDLRGVVRDELDLLFAKEGLEVRLRDVGLDEPGLLRDLLPPPGG